MIVISCIEQIEISDCKNSLYTCYIFYILHWVSLLFSNIWSKDIKKKGEDNKKKKKKKKKRKKERKKKKRKRLNHGHCKSKDFNSNSDTLTDQSWESQKNKHFCQNTCHLVFWDVFREHCKCLVRWSHKRTHWHLVFLVFLFAGKQWLSTLVV